MNAAPSARAPIVVTGATGTVGRPLVAELVRRGHRVIALSRDAARAHQTLAVAAIEADLQTAGPWCDALAGAAAIIHLAGESVAARRWTARHKQIIRESRVESARVIVEAVARLPPAQRPATVITASGIDYYPYALPPLDDDEVTERDAPSDNFLARVCRDWEREVFAAEQLGARCVAFRIGLVLAPSAALSRLTRPFRWFVGGRLASGQQWVSWVHVDDVVAAIASALTDERYRGPINMVAGSVRNREFSDTLARTLHRPSWLPVPAVALRIAVGEFAEVITHGRRVVPQRLAELGFQFSHPDLARSLELVLLNQPNQVAP